MGGSIRDGTGEFGWDKCIGNGMPRCIVDMMGVWDKISYIRDVNVVSVYWEHDMSVLGIRMVYC